MKKLFASLLSVLMTASILTGCGASQPETTPTGYEKNFSVAIVQQLDHSSLDEIRTAMEAKLRSLA